MAARVQLDTNTITALAEATRSGLKGRYVADIVSVTERTLNRWKAAGQQELDRLADNPDAEPDPNQAAYVQLVLAIRDARARYVQDQLRLIERAAVESRTVKTVTRRDPKTGETVVERTETVGGQWTAAAWLIERGDPQEFGRQIVRTEITGADGGPVQIDTTTEAQLVDKLAAYYQGVADGQQTPVEEPS